MTIIEVKDACHRSLLASRHRLWRFIQTMFCLFHALACPTNWIQSAANPNKCFYMENAAVEFELVPQLCRDRAGSDEAKPVTIANAFENEELRSWFSKYFVK